jgi:Zn finger protein HypA/HybF involved in hydrogenase expression
MELKDVPCKDCQQVFPRVTRSKVCQDCAIIRKKVKKSVRNKKYYKKNKDQKARTVDMS